MAQVTQSVNAQKRGKTGCGKARTIFKSKKSWQKECIGIANAVQKMCEKRDAKVDKKWLLYTWLLGQ